jgi:hypothetical protein
MRFVPFTVLAFWIPLTLACAGRSAAPEPQPVPTFVGLEYEGQLPGTSMLTGMLLNEEAGVEFSLELLEAPGGRLLVMQRLLERNASGKPRWRVLATFRAPHVPRKHRLVFYSCARGGAVDVNIFAVARDEEDFTLDQVLAAWRAEPTRSQLVSVPPHEVTCENEGWEPNEIDPPAAG